MYKSKKPNNNKQAHCNITKSQEQAPRFSFDMFDCIDKLANFKSSIYLILFLYNYLQWEPVKDNKIYDTIDPGLEDGDGGNEQSAKTIRCL